MGDRSVFDMMRSISALVLLDLDGSRLIAHYYDKATFPDLKSQKVFERKVMRQKTLLKSEISFIDDLICLNLNHSDIRFFVAGPLGGNELVMKEFLACVVELLRVMFKETLSCQSLMENMHAVFILLDEICEAGVILETNPLTIVDRLRARSVRSIEDMTLGELLEFAKEKLMTM
ncbi:unnamed protein product [Notodromas monacha]|uniref:Coatomer subunit zeta n=1 Tax=Notodromas monacha TaxID=399045 RepID=A0A7R9BUQ2_9CRUS|nr:unnamed protein product [Notodromas monacha]CAG0921024.1 unnamed protein product [Notodromas monacha]